MNWNEAALAFHPLDKKSLSRFLLSAEEEDVVLNQFNKSLRNATSDSADVAVIALRKLLTRFPDWGEAVLLYGICLAMDGKIGRAQASFDHALSVGLRSQELTYLAQVCLRDASEEREARSHNEVEESPAKALISSVLPRTNPLIQEEGQIRPRNHMQAPILMKAPRHPTRARLASDRERRELMMQSTSSNGELPDDEIEVSIPKTPAEKLRIALFCLGAVILLVGGYFLVTNWMIPEIMKIRSTLDDRNRLEYLSSALYENKEDPEISNIISQYESAFPTQSESSSANAENSSDESSTAAAVSSSEETTDSIT
jgi:hypothetical protein